MIDIPFTWYAMGRLLTKSEDEVYALKNEMFLRQIKYVSQNIPFYKEVFKKNKLKLSDFEDVSSIQLLPVIDKDLVIKNLDLFINPNFSKSKLKRSFTSGSTGQPFASYFDKKSWIRKKYLSKLRARFFTGLKLTDRLIILDSEPQEVNRKYNSRWVFRTPFLRTQYVSVLEDPMNAIKKIVDFNPDVIYGPPSYIFQLGEEYQKLEKGGLKLKRIFTSSELLSKPVSRFIKTVFTTDILDIYGSTEFKEVAWECPFHSGYHINEDEVHVEIIDEQENPIEKGVGFVVLSDLRNKAFPLLRYKIKDLGSFIPGNCNCGCSFAKMAPVGGRATDFVILPSGKKVSPYLVEDVVELVTEINQYQVIQDSLNELTLKLKTDAKYHDIVKSKLRSLLSDVLKENMILNFEFVDHIDVEENGKFKLVKSYVA